MKTSRIVSILLATVAILLTSCIKDTLENSFLLGKGAVEVSADFSVQTGSLNLPDEYTIILSSQEFTVPTSGAVLLEHNFEPGDATLTAFCIPEGMERKGMTLQMCTLPDGTIKPVSEALFSYRADISIPKDDTLKISLPMKQHLINVQFELPINERDAAYVENIEAVISGIAQQFDIEKQKVVKGSPASIRIAMTPERNNVTKSSQEVKYIARTCLLGVDGVSQDLTINIDDIFGKRKTLVTDISNILQEIETSHEEGQSPDNPEETPEETPVIPIEVEVPSFAPANYSILYYGTGTPEFKESEDIYVAINDNFSASSESLTDFIDQAVEQYPAQKYILVLEGQCSSVLYGEENRFTAQSLKTALQNAGTRIDAIYFNGALTSSIEYLYELRELTDYILSSNYYEAGSCGNYKMLMELLEANSEMADALISYVSQVGVANDGLFFDIILTRTESLSGFIEILKEFTDKLIIAYQSGDPQVKGMIDKITSEMIFRVFESDFGYDVSDFVADMCNEEYGIPDKIGPDFLNSYKELYNKCAIASFTSEALQSSEISAGYSIAFATQGTFVDTDFANSVIRVYDADGTLRQGAFTFTESFKFDLNDYLHNHLSEFETIGNWGSTFAETYQQLDFDKQSGWSRWITINETYPRPFSHTKHDGL